MISSNQRVELSAGASVAAAPTYLNDCCAFEEISKRKSDSYPATRIPLPLLLSGCCCGTEWVILWFASKQPLPSNILLISHGRNLPFFLTHTTPHSGSTGWKATLKIDCPQRCQAHGFCILMGGSPGTYKPERTSRGFWGVSRHCWLSIWGDFFERGLLK